MPDRFNLAFEEPSDKINGRLTEHSKIFRRQIYRTADHVYSAMGYALDVPVMVEGEDGVIIIDPCESQNAMAQVMDDFRKITDKPVKAVIYTHHHPDHWGGVKAVVTQEDVDSGRCQIIAQEGFERELARMTGVLCDIKVGRALYMYGYLLPVGQEGRVNLGLGPCMVSDEQHMIHPTVFVGEEMKTEIAGVELEFYHIPSECKDEICIWMPQKQVLHVAECIQGENFPNLYSIRGSNRDPMKWVQSIDFMRTFPAEFLVGNHMRPVEGRGESADHLRDYRDMIQYTHDQTIRLINKGLTPDNIIKALEKLPPHLYQRPRMGEFYGTFIQGIKLVYSLNLGWFNGDAVNLNPLSPRETAEKYVELVGRDCLLAEAIKAIREKEYQWAAQLTTHLVAADHGDMEARHWKAEALRNLGYLTENGPFRNWYLTQAMNLDGHFEAVKEQVPDFDGPGPYLSAISRVHSRYLWDCLRVKLDGIKTSYVERTLTVCITDEDVTNDLEIRRGILEVHEAGTGQSIGEVSMEKMDFVMLFTKIKSVEALHLEGKLKTTAPLVDVVQFFGYFDGFTPLFDMEFPFE